MSHVIMLITKLSWTKRCHLELVADATLKSKLLVGNLVRTIGTHKNTERFAPVIDRNNAVTKKILIYISFNDKEKACIKRKT